MRAPWLSSLLLFVSACSSADFELGSGANDASPADAVVDGRVPDAAPPTDATPTDGSPPIDAPPACPAPDTMSTYDATPLTCATMPMEYQVKLADAKKCNCDADCRRVVRRDFCGCETFVNPSRDSAAALDAIQNWWTKKSCPTACSDFVCPPTGAAHCVLSGGFGTCVDGV